MLCAEEGCGWRHECEVSAPGFYNGVKDFCVSSNERLRVRESVSSRHLGNTSLTRVVQPTGETYVEHLSWHPVKTAVEATGVLRRVVNNSSFYCINMGMSVDHTNASL